MAQHIAVAYECLHSFISPVGVIGAGLPALQMHGADEFAAVLAGDCGSGLAVALIAVHIITLTTPNALNSSANLPTFGPK